MKQIVYFIAGHTYVCPQHINLQLFRGGDWIDVENKKTLSDVGLKEGENVQWVSQDPLLSTSSSFQCKQFHNVVKIN